MAPLTKDSVEAASPAASTPVVQTGAQSKPTSSLRADALSLEVAVKVHGSRVLEVARGTAPRTEPFEEQTVTMIVFPQGAVLRMATVVNVSQMLVLTNIKTKQDSICRVLKVRPNANQGSYVEVEFTHRQPGYWGVQFPSEGSVATNSGPSPQVNLESQKIAPASPTPVTRPAVAANPRDSKPASVAPTAPFVPPAKPESSFISIGSQEKVQEAASATAITKPLSPVEMRLEGLADPFAKAIPAVDPLPAAPSTAPVVSMDDLRGDSDSVSPSSASTATEEHSTSATSSASRDVAAILGDAGSEASPTSTSEAFGARLDSSFGSSVAQSSGSNQNWMLIAACVAVLVAGLGAGIAYFRQHAGNPSASRTAPAAVSASSTAQPATNDANQLPAITPAGQPYTATGADVNAAARPGGNAPPVAAASSSANNAAKAPVPAPPANHSPAPTKTTPGVTSDMVSTALTSRPTTWTRGSEGQADQAPVLDAASASGSSPLPGITGPNAAALPMPTAQPEGPAKIGGNVKEPKLLNSAAPAYPLSARSSGVQGDVVIETIIDKSGNVVRTHVVSGPAMLRPSALEALKHWKYEPSRLDGEPVEVQMQVTIRFRL
jgi:TonB family protein